MSTKTVRFYSEEEYNALKSFIEEDKSLKAENLNNFCKKFNRSLTNTRAYIYAQRKRLLDKTEPNKKTQLLKTKKAILKSSEFHIPITKWELLKIEDKFTLVLKF
jgi:hypothetical protein